MLLFWKYTLAGSFESIAVSLNNSTADVWRSTDGFMNGTIQKINMTARVNGSIDTNFQIVSTQEFPKW